MEASQTGARTGNHRSRPPSAQPSCNANPCHVRSPATTVRVASVASSEGSTRTGWRRWVAGGEGGCYSDGRGGKVGNQGYTTRAMRHRRVWRGSEWRCCSARTWIGWLRGREGSGGAHERCEAALPRSQVPHLTSASGVRPHTPSLPSCRPQRVHIQLSLVRAAFVPPTIYHRATNSTDAVISPR